MIRCFAAKRKRRRGGVEWHAVVCATYVFLAHLIAIASASCPPGPGASACEVMACHDDNPFATACAESDVAWESEVITSFLGPNGTQFDYSDLSIRAKSTTGSCVRNCGTISSTETDRTSGAQRTREIDFMAAPPMIVVEAQLAGAVPQRAHTFSSATCDISAKTLMASTGRNQTGVYQAALSAAISHGAEAGGRRLSEDTSCPDASAGAGRRRLASALTPEHDTPTWLGEGVDDMMAMPMHHSVADDHLLDLMRKERAVRVSSVMSRGASSSLKSRGATQSQLLSPKSAIFSRLRDTDMKTILQDLPSIEPSVWSAALTVVFGKEGPSTPEQATEEMENRESSGLVFTVALAMQRSRNAHFQDLYGTEWRSITNAGPARSIWDDMTAVSSLDTVSVVGHPRKLLVGAAIGVAALAVAGVALDQALKNADAINDIVDKMDVLDAAMDANADLARAAQRTAEASAAEAAATQDAFLDVQRGFECVEALATAIAAQATENSDRIEELGDEVTSIRAAQNAGFLASAAERAANTERIAQVAADAQVAIDGVYADLTSAVQTTADFLGGRIDALQDNMDASLNSISQDVTLVSDQATSNARSIRTLSSSLYDERHQRDARRRVTQVFHTLRRQLTQFYWQPFLAASTLSGDNLVDADPESWWREGSPRRRMKIDTMDVYTVRRGEGLSSDIYGGGGTNHELRKDRFTLFCDAAVLMVDAMPWWTPKDLLVLLGNSDTCAPPDALGNGGLDTYDAWAEAYIQPDGSSTWNPEMRPLCKCWFEASASSCPINLGSDTARAVTRGTGESVDMSKHLGKPGLAGIPVTGGGMTHDPCSGATVSSIPEATRQIASLANYTAAMVDVCAPADGRDLSHLLPSDFQKLSGDVADALPLSASVSVSERLSTVMPDVGFVVALGAPYSNSSVCGTDSTTLSELTHTTPASAFEYFMRNSWRATFDDLKHLDIARYGSMGNDVTVHERSFNIDIGSASTFTCHDVEFAGIQGGMEPVYRLRPQGYVKRFEAWMAPVPPSAPGAADGRPAVHYTTSDPEIVVDLDFMIPTDTVYVGNPECMFRPCARPPVREYVNGTFPDVRYLYDIPGNDLSLNPDPTVRVGTASYLLYKNTTLDPATGDYPALDPAFQYTLDDWQADHPGETFDVTAAGADISSFMREVVETPGGLGAGDVTCSGEGSPGDGSLCTLLANFYFVVPSFAVDPETGAASGVHAYLADTPAAACATPGSGVLCLAPRDWDSIAVARVPVGEISQTLGSACPEVNDELLVNSGIPTLRLANRGTSPIEFQYDWAFAGPNTNLDSPNAQTAWDLLRAGDPDAPHPCYGESQLDVDGGVIAAGSSVNLQATISNGVSLCSQWTLTLRIPDPATLLWTQCAVHNVSISNIGLMPALTSGEDLTFTTEYTFPIDDTAAQAQLQSVGDATSSILTDRDIRQRYLTAHTPGGEAAYQEYLTTITGYTPPPDLGQLASNFSGEADATRERDAERAANAQAALDASIADSEAFSAATAVSQAAVDAAFDNLRAQNDALNATVAAQAAAVLALQDAVANQAEATRNFTTLVEAFTNITLEHVDTSIARALGDIGGTVTDIAEGAVEGVVTVAEGAADLAKEAMDEALGLISGLLGLGGFLGDIIDFIFMALIIVGICLAVYYAWKCGLFKCCGKACNGRANSGTLSPAAKLEVLMMIQQNSGGGIAAQIAALQASVNGTPKAKKEASKNGNETPSGSEAEKEEVPGAGDAKDKHHHRHKHHMGSGFVVRQPPPSRRRPGRRPARGKYVDTSSDDEEAARLIPGRRR